MKGYYKILLVLLFVFFLIFSFLRHSLSTKTKTNSEVVPTSTTVPSFIFGVNAHMAKFTEDNSADLALIKNAHFTSIRDDVPWNLVEKTKGHYAVPTYIETNVNKILAAGLTPLLVLDFTNPIYDNNAYPTEQNKEVFDGFEKYATFLVNHYKGRVHMYELWNEWDVRQLRNNTPDKTGDPADYIYLLKDLYPKLKAIDPNAIILGGGGLSPPSLLALGWLQDFEKANAFEYMDGLSIHYYTFATGTPTTSPQLWISKIKQVEKAVEAARKEPIPIYITETGWPTYVSTSTATTLQAQVIGAKDVLHFVTTDPNIKGFWWYDFIDDGTSTTNREDNFGLLSYSGALKPAYFVFKNFISPPSTSPAHPEQQ